MNLELSSWVSPSAHQLVLLHPCCQHPQTGEETRQLIKDRAIELKEKGAESYEETKRKAEIAYKDAVAKYEQFAETTKEKAAEFGQQVKTKVDEIVHPAEKAVEEN